MIKAFHLIRGNNYESYPEFRTRIFEKCSRLASADAVSSIKCTITDEKPPAISAIPFGSSKIAAIRVESDHSESHQVFDEMEGFVGSYKVSEALPVSYEKTWSNNERTPGVCLLTLFRKKKSLPQEEFISRWHNGHTPLSLKIHPLWHYSRNVVTGGIGEPTTWYDGIVEEHFQTRSQLMNPLKFFGNPVTMLPNMLRVYFDVKSFLDYPSIEPYLVSEYHFK